MKKQLKNFIAVLTTFSFFLVFANLTLALTVDNSGNVTGIVRGRVLSRQSGQTQASTSGKSENKTPELNTSQTLIIENRNESGKLKIQTKNGKMQIDMADENGEVTSENGIELSNDDEIEIEESTDTGKIRIRNREDQILIMKNKLAAQTHFPLMVNLETNELIVTTPKGSKVVTVLPDAAVAHMLAANVLDQVGGKGGLLWLEYQEQFTTPTPQATESATPESTPIESPTPEATQSAEPSPTAEATIEPTVEPTPLEGEELPIILTTTSDGTLVYEIKGIKQKKLFWFYKVDVPRTAIVSAETGELLGIRRNFGATILEIFSF